MPRMKTYDWTAKVSNGRDHDGEAAGIVKAPSEAAARAAIAECIHQDGIRRAGPKTRWTVLSIELS